MFPDPECDFPNGIKTGSKYRKKWPNLKLTQKLKLA